MTSISIGLGLILAAVLLFLVCMPKEGVVRPFLQNMNLQTWIGLFITTALAAGILLVLHGTFA